VPWDLDEFQVIGPDDLHDLLKELFPEHDIDDNFVQDLLDAAFPSGYFQSSSKPTRPKQEVVAKKTAQAWGVKDLPIFKRMRGIKESPVSCWNYRSIYVYIYIYTCDLILSRFFSSRIEY